MAEFPVYQSSRSLPGEGPSVRGNVDTRTGAGAIGAGLSDLGASAAELGHTIFRQQGESEFVDAMAKAKEKTDAMLLDFETNTDETTYHKTFEETFSQIEDAEIKNGWAKMQYRNAMPNMRAALKGVVNKAVAARVEDKYKATEAKLSADAEQTGALGPLDAFYKRAVSDNRMTPEDVDAKMAKVRHGASQQRMAAMVGNDPQWFLDNITSPADLDKFDPDSIPTDYAWLSGLAKASLADRKKERGKWWDSVVNDTLGKAQNMDPSEFRSQLIQTPGLTEEQRTELLETYLKAARLWQDEGRSPYSVTQNEASLVQAYIGIEDGSITSLDELNKLYLEGNRVNWSTEDMLRVKSAFYASQGIKSGDAALYAEPATQEAIDRLRPLYFDEKGNFKDPTPERHTQYLHDRMATIEAIKQNPDSIVKRNAAVEEAQKPSRLKAARNWLGEAAKWGLVPGPWWMGAKAVGGAYKSLLAGEDIPTPNTQAEYDALPTGSRFIDKKDGQIYVKK